MNTCTDFFREYQRNDRAIGFAAPGADSEKLETAKERNQFLLAHAKASSSRDAAYKVYMVSRLLNAAGGDEEQDVIEKTQSLLRVIAQRLRHDCWTSDDECALRRATAVVESIPTCDESPDGCGLTSSETDLVSTALRTALAIMRPRRLH
jgi:hypothetical protein